MPEEKKMHNPYEKEGVAHSEVAIRRGHACALIAAFILMLLLPPLYRNVYQASVGGGEAWVPVTELFKKPAAQSITGHLKAFENDLEDRAAFTEPPRQFVQGALARTLREGNRKTYIGRDGWLYLKPALDSLTGYGPISAEPDSVTKDPNRPPWHAPLGAIKTFAGQLDELGVELVLVPIPVKPMIYPEHITGRRFDGPLTHRDAGTFYKEIEALPNATVIDLSKPLWTATAGAQIFLKQDTHWTPEGMMLAAKLVAQKLPPDLVLASLKAGEPLEVRAIGDLVEQLNLPGDGHGNFQPETAKITPVAGFVPDPTSPVTLLGDSFTNIYSAATLGWGEGAGFAQHLALELGQPIDVIAMNGQASTGVRSELAARGRAHLKTKKLVIWAIAARDLFLSETTARENDVKWENVTIPDIPDAAKRPAAACEPLQITGTLIMKSAIKDPRSVTYKNAIFLCEYKVDQVIEGQYEGETILVKDWAFRDKQLTAASRHQVGDQVALRLVPFDTKTKLQNEQEFNDIDTEDIDKLIMVNFWSEPIAAAGDQAAGGKPGASAANKTRATTIASIACMLAALLVIALVTRIARSGAEVTA